MALWKLLRGRLDKARRPRSYRPRLEALETRELLSVCTVDRLTDGNPGGGGQGSNGRGDLRWCVTESLFQAGTINFSVMGTINLNARLPTLGRNVSIEGPGANFVTVRRGTAGDYGIFTVATGVTAVISGLTISNGDEGGISNSGSLTVSNSTIAGNSYGGIYNGGSLTVSNSTIAGNSVAYSAGIFNEQGTLTVNNSTIANNGGGGSGGIDNGGTLTVNNSTIANNSVGGINSSGTLTINNSTITGNSSAYQGGGILSRGTTTIRNTIIARNTAPSGPDVYGNMGSQGHNLLGNPQDASGWTNTDLLHVDPMLGPLQSNGGLTFTMALIASSPALDAGDPDQANTADQRGVPRTGGVNIGAYQASATTFLVAGFPSPINPGTSGSVTVTARDPYSNTAPGYRGTVHFTSSDAQAMLPANYTFTAADNGVHTFSVTLNTPGTQSITVTDTSMPALTGTQAGIQVGSAASIIQVAGFPSPIVAGVAGNTTVTIKDSHGNVITSYRGTVHFTSSDRQATLPGNYTFTAADSSVHTFSATLKTAGTQSITVTDTVMPTLTGTQSGIVVNAAAANTLSVSFTPSPITAGANGSLMATAQDAYGNVARGYRGIVHFTSSDPQASVPSNYTFAAGDNGSHTFSVILKTAGNQTITVADTANPALTASALVLVTPAAVAMLRMAGFPSPVAAGNPQLLTVTAQDPYGNTTPVYRGTIHFSSSDPQALLAYDYTFIAADNGSHPFAAVFGTVGTQTLTAADTVNAAITGTQSGIVVTPGKPDHFQVTASVSSTVAGTPFDITVTVRDRFNNTVTGYTGTVAFSSADPYGATLPANYTFQPADQGMATFASGVTLYTAGTWDITATDTSSGTTGAAFVNVVAAPAAAFQVVAPASVASGTAFDVTVLAVDLYGNTDTNYQGTVTFSTSDGAPGVVLPPDYTFQPADTGMATFPAGVTLITPGDQTLSVTDTGGGITGAATVTVTAGGDAGSSPDRATLDDWFAAHTGKRYGNRDWIALATADSVHRRLGVGPMEVAL